MFSQNHKKLRQELRDLLVRDFAMKHKLSDDELVGLLLTFLFNNHAKRVLSEVKKLFVDKFMFADRFYEKNELLAIFKQIFDELEQETIG